MTLPKRRAVSRAPPTVWRAETGVGVSKRALRPITGRYHEADGRVTARTEDESSSASNSKWSRNTSDGRLGCGFHWGVEM